MLKELIISQPKYLIGDLERGRNSIYEQLQVDLSPGKYLVRFFNVDALEERIGNWKFGFPEFIMLHSDFRIEDHTKVYLGQITIDSGLLSLESEIDFKNRLNEDRAEIVGISFWGEKSSEIADKLGMLNYSISHRNGYSYTINCSENDYPFLKNKITEFAINLETSIQTEIETDSTISKMRRVLFSSESGHSLEKQNMIKVSNYGEGIYNIFGYLGSTNILHGVCIYY